MLTGDAKSVADQVAGELGINYVYSELLPGDKVAKVEELLEEKIKTTHDLDSFVKIDGDQIRVVIDSDDHSNTIANNIMKTIQNNFDTKQYISIPFITYFNTNEFSKTLLRQQRHM